MAKCVPWLFTASLAIAVGAGCTAASKPTGPSSAQQPDGSGGASAKDCRGDKSTSPGPTGTSLKDLEGTWRRWEITRNGGGKADLVGQPDYITITGDRYETAWNPIDGWDPTPDKGSVRIDPSQNPRTLDLINDVAGSPLKGKPQQCIYELKDGVLTIVMSELLGGIGKARPKSFSDNGAYVYVFTKPRPGK